MPARVAQAKAQASAVSKSRFAALDSSDSESEAESDNHSPTAAGEEERAARGRWADEEEDDEGQLKAAQEFVEIANGNLSDADFAQQLSEMDERIEDECNSMIYAFMEAGAADRRSKKSSCNKKDKNRHEGEVRCLVEHGKDVFDQLFKLKTSREDFVRENREHDLQLVKARQTVKKFFNPSGKRSAVEEVQDGAAKFAKPQQIELDMETEYSFQEIFRFLSNPLRNTTTQLKNRVDARITGSVVKNFVVSLYDSDDYRPEKRNVKTVSDLLIEFKTMDTWDEQLKTFCNHYFHKENEIHEEQEGESSNQT